MIITFNSAIKALLLLILAIFGNYFNMLLPCNLQHLFTSNTVIRHIFFIFMITITTDLTKFLNNNTKYVDPIFELINSLIIYIAFLIFSKQNIYFVSILLVLLIVYYINNKYINYFNNTNTIINSNILNIMNYIDNYMFYVFMIITITGYIVYFLKQYKEKKNFNILKFIFGTNTCDKLQ